jgi:hypothetical protein
MHVSGRQVIIGLLAAGVLLYIVQLYTNATVETKLEAASLALEANIAEQEVVLVTIADLAKQSGADEITEQIVVDCSAAERQRFESLLDKLSGTITRTELLELDSLFFACGSFFADRKAVMVARLIREVAVYRDYIALRNRVLSADTVDEERVLLWQRIADDELMLSSDFNKLVDLQRDIIMALLAGKSRDSAEIATTLTAVTETRNNMTVRIQQIENTRAELLSI